MTAPFVWFDLTVAGPDQARRFYEELFGWTPAPGGGDYAAMLAVDDQPWAGLHHSEEVPAGRWIPYVVVEDLEAAGKQAVALGGRIIRTARSGPAGTSVVVADPDGALVALFVPHGAAA